MARKTGSFAETTGPKVRQAALRLFARDGFAAVSMRQIAAEVGLQAGALYSYTPDKQTLLFALLHAHLEARAALLPGPAAPPEEPTLALQAFTLAHLRFHAEAPEASDLLRLETRSLTPENRAKVAQLEAAYHGRLEAILGAGAAGKLFATPQTGLAAGAVLGLLQAALLWGRENSLPQERFERIVWNMVRRSVGARGAQ